MGWSILANRPKKGPGSIVAVVPMPWRCDWALVCGPLQRKALGRVVGPVSVAHFEDLGASLKRSWMYQRHEEAALEASKPPATGGHQ